MSEVVEIRTGDGTRLAAERLPADGPQVALLHAGVADRRAWADVARGLNGRGADVIYYDRRGFGETIATSSGYRHEEDLIAVLDAFAREPVWLVGNSQGGLIALDAALGEPERVAGLILIAPAVSGAPDPADDDLDPATRRLVEEIDRAEEAGDAETLNELEIRLWLDGPAATAERVVGPARALALQMNRRALATAGPEPTISCDAWASLEEIDLPTTVAWGELDLPEIISRCKGVADRLANVRGVTELPGVAHLPALERPDLVTSLLAESIGL